MADSIKYTEEERRRRRIRLYKKIIILFLLFLILLPTVFCVILFVRVGNLQKQLNTLMAIRLSQSEEQSEVSSDAAVLPGNIDYVYAMEPETTEDKTQQESTSEGSAQSEASTQETFGISDKEMDKVVSVQPSEGMYGAYSEDMIEKALEEGRKVVYLTFDDGPSHNTERILDILDEYKVKATFFTIGNENEEYLDDYARIVEDGHSLGMHSYSHKYSTIYSSVEAFDEDYQKISAYLEKVTGVAPWLYRFPGGSSNLVSAIPMTNFIKYLNDKGITYYDWNVSAQDAEGKELPVDTLLDNIFKDIDRKDICVVLMHDSDYLGTTVEMLPELLKRLTEMDAVILPITENTTLIQHISADSVQ